MTDTTKSDVTTIVQLVRDHKPLPGSGMGLGWDELLTTTKFSDERLEEAINIALDRGDIYEPILGRFKVVDR